MIRKKGITENLRKVLVKKKKKSAVRFFLVLTGKLLRVSYILSRGSIGFHHEKFFLSARDNEINHEKFF